MSNRPLQTSLNYHLECNTSSVVQKMTNAYELHANSKLPYDELKGKIPEKINLLTSVPDKEGRMQSRYTIIGTLHYDTLQEELTAVQSKKEKTKGLRKCDLSYLTIVYDRLARHIFFTFPTVLLDPIAIISKDDKDSGSSSSTTKKTSIDSSTLEWYEFFVLPLKTAAQVIINLYIHNNPDETTKNNIRVSPLFTDFKLGRPIDKDGKSDKDEISLKTIKITPTVVFPRLPTAFLNEGAFKDITLRSSEYILMPGEVIKKSGEEGSKKRAKRSNDSSDEEKDNDPQEEAGDHDTLAYLDADDGFDVAPSRKSASSSSKKKSPSSTQVITKEKQKVAQVSINLEDDSGEETESTASKQPAKKRQTTSAKKNSDDVAKTRVSASLIAGSLTVNSLSDDIIEGNLKNGEQFLPSSSLSEESPTHLDGSSSSIERDFISQVHDFTAETEQTRPKIQNQVKKLMSSTLEILEGLKSGNALRRCLGNLLLEKVPELSKASLEAAQPEFVDNMSRLTVDEKSRVYFVKNQLGIPKDTHLPLGVYSLLFEFLKEENPALVKQLDAGKGMMAQPRTEAGQSVFVPMTPDQTPAGNNSPWYAFMLFQGAVNAGMTIDLFSECVAGTSEAFVPELEKYLSTIEKMEKDYEQRLKESKEKQMKLVELGVSYLRKAETKIAEIETDSDLLKSQYEKEIEEKNLEIQVLKDRIDSLEKELVHVTKASAKAAAKSSTPVKPKPTLSIKELPLTLKTPVKKSLPSPSAPKKDLDLEDDPIEDPDESDDELDRLIGTKSKPVKEKEPESSDGLPDIRERSEWHLTRRPAPTVKQAIYHEKYIDVVIGNPGHVTRLEIDFGCVDTIILFAIPEDTSKTWSDHPSTVIAYFGPVLLRLSFTIDPSKKDPRSYYSYEGYLCLGPHSDLWDYWSKITISPFRLVLGEFDKTLSRINYDPFEFVFHKNNSHDSIQGVVDGKKYPLVFNLENDHSFFPRLLYQNITSLTIDINNLCFMVDKEDVLIHLSNGFDRTMLRKSFHHEEDNTIVLGKHFARNFVIYFDGVSKTKYIVPSFHLFNGGRGEHVYATFTLCVITLLIIIWISIVTVKQFRDIQKPSSFPYSNSLSFSAPFFAQPENVSSNPESIQGGIQFLKKRNVHQPYQPQNNQSQLSVVVIPGLVPQKQNTEVSNLSNPVILYGMELYGYITSIIIIIVDMNGFAGYRHFNYLLSTTSNTLYIIINSAILLNNLFGMVATFASLRTYRFLNIRRVFFETSLFLTLWIVSAHQHKTHSIIFLTMIFSAVYVNMRILHTAMNIILKKRFMSLVTLAYTILAFVFYILYNILPVMDFFFFKFDDQLERILLFIIITIGIPSLALIGWYNFSIISNTVESINQNYLVKYGDQMKKKKNPDVYMNGNGYFDTENDDHLLRHRNSLHDDYDFR